MGVSLALKAAGFIGLDVVGIPGNLGVLLLFCHLFLAQGHMPHNEFILSQLVFANLMVTLCRGIPQALTALGIDLFFGEHACRAMIFAYRLGRAMSITLTSLLSSYLCVIIAPPTPGWTWLKRWLPGHLPHAIIFLYGLNMVIYTTAILFSHAVPANGGGESPGSADGPEGQMGVRLALKAAGFIGLDVVGIPGNLAVLLLFCHLFLAQGHMPHNEFILSQLVFANLMVTLCRGIPQALTALGIDLFFGEHACRGVIFAYRLGRAMSITLTSLLSSYQCVVIAPPTPGWTWLKRWVPGHLPHAIVFLYGLNMIVHSTAILFTHAVPANSSLPEFTINLKFCIVVFPGHIAYRFCGVVYMIRDFTFVGLMAAAAVYVMLVLHRHRKQVQGLQGAGRKTEEASRAVLLLVSTYVALFSLANVLWFYSLFNSREHPLVTDTRVFFSSCYSAISPVLIIATNKKLATWFQCGSKRKAAENVPSNTKSNASLVTITQ